MEHIKIKVGDIVKMECDVIVNAANRSLLGGGGVDGAIHRAAGNELYDECKVLGGCQVGHAKITNGYKLPCKYVIHTVAPYCKDGKATDEDRKKLASCYRSTMGIAKQYDVKSIIFPCIGTGVYKFPKDEAASIAVREVKKALDDGFDCEVTFCCFTDADAAYYEKEIAKDDNK